jgi:hypothetical protein
MRVGVFRPDKMAFSFRNHSDHVVRQLRVMGADIITFRRDVSLPAAVDLFWDPKPYREISFHSTRSGIRAR